MAGLNQIIDKVKSYHPQADMDLINKAYVFSSKKHDGQMRKSGDPYFVHPVSVASIVADMKLDDASVCAALLHDVLEDTDTTKEEIAKLFNPEVAFLVEGVTKLGNLNFTCREDRQAESLRKMLVAMARDIRVLLLKLADRLDNMRTLQFMKPESQERIARETLDIYAPLAGRLGMQWMKASLEDLSFAYSDPESYQELKLHTQKAAQDNDHYVAEVTKQIQTMLVEKGFAVKVQGRQKNLFSVYNKMKNNGYSFDQIHDLVAFRVITESVADCYATLGVLHSTWTPVPGRFKDYIALPKGNFYQSLHTTVIGPQNRRVEIQIRTHEMQKVSEFGIAAHWQYKDGGAKLDPKDVQRFTWLRQMLEYQTEVSDPAEFYENVKIDLFPEEVNVFTPKGDVKTLPKGSTPVDFAYSVHSEVGHHCAGSRVNGAMVPLRTLLRNGDVVDIITQQNHVPTKDWLQYVITGKARSRIRSYLRNEERKRSIQLGKDLFEREMRKADLSFARFLKGKEIIRVLDLLGYKNTDELFASLGYGRISSRQLMDGILAEKPEPEVRQSLRPGLIERTVRRVRARDQSDGIQIDGIDGLLVRFAKCCTPVVGEPVVGWITRGRGVTIHRRTCNKSMELDQERRVDVTWSEDSQVNLPVTLRIELNDVPGVLSKITTLFNEFGISIIEANCRPGREGRAVNHFHFTVPNIKKLNQVMRELRHLEEVVDVYRT